MAVIETDGLSKLYKSWFSSRRVHALDDLHLSVNENRIFGFLGPNGAGKTTTIKLLLGLIEATSGSGMVLGAPLGDQDTREKIGFLPDSPQFYAHMSAKDFLYYCAKLLHLSWEEYAPRVERLLDRMNLSSEQNRKLGGFSRGMLQRVGIVQALLSDPVLLILDEPLTGLDPLGRVEIKNIMHELKDEGKTVFFSSHILADVEEMCDDIGILNRGRLLVCGAVSDFLAEKNVTVWVKNLSAEDLESAEEMADSVTKRKNQWGFALKSCETVDDFRKVVERFGGEVIKIDTTKESLETYFFAAIEHDNGNGKKKEDA